MPNSRLWGKFSHNDIPPETLVVGSMEDLPDAVGDEITLPAKTVLIGADIDIGSDSLRLSTGTLLRGLGGQIITSSNTNGVIRATNLGEAVVMREVSVLGTAGPCLDLVGTTDHQLNLFFMGLFGASAGTITGFDVQGVKDCFIQAASGLTFDGTTNKIFISQCPFYGMVAGAAAITLPSTLNARRCDMIYNFFKADPASVGIRAESGYTVGYGRVTGSMSDGPTTVLDGLASSDTNWWFDKNDLIADSRVAAQASLNSATTTAITTVGAYESLSGAFTLTSLSQRMSLNAQDQLVYNAGDMPILITFSVTITLDPAKDVRVGLRAMKNGSTLAYSQSYIDQGSGTANQPRLGSLTALIELNPGDYVSLAIANLTDTQDIDVLSAGYSVVAS